jgi:hypothetical protein
MKHGGEVYADFTVNRIVRNLGEFEPLTERQRSVLRDVLIAENGVNRHKIDIRLFIPLFYGNFYVCLFAGRDRRKSTINALALRWARTQRRLNRGGLFVFISLMSVVLAAAMILGLYKLKTWLGIDLIPGWHFSEFVSNLLA